MQTPVLYNPFLRPELEQVVPLTNAQQEIWVSCQLGGDAANVAYNESLRITFEGPMNEAAMLKAINEVQQINVALRSVISGNGAFMCVETQATSNIQLHDIAHLAAQKQEAFIEQTSANETATPFVLTNSPLIRWHIIKQQSQLHTVIVTAHHIICDGWSLGILLQHLGNFYSALVANKPALKAAVQPFSFANYAVEQFYYTQSTAYEETLSYWKSKITKEALAAHFPTTFGRTQSRTYASFRADKPLSGTAVNVIKALAKENATSFNTVLISIFENWVQLQTNQDTTVIGLPVAGQSALSNTAMIGHCVQLIPLVASHQNEDICSYIKRRKSALLDDYEAAQVSFGDIVKQLQLSATNTVPLVPVVLNIDLGLVNQVHFEALNFTVFTNKRPFETFELYVNITGTEAAPVFEWSYNTQLFSDKFINDAHASLEAYCAWLQHNFHTAVKGCYIPATVLGTSIWSEGQLYNAAPLPLTHSLQQQWNQSVTLYPQKNALIVGGHVYTYHQLHQLVETIASCLQANGVTNNSTVAILLPRQVELPAAMLACWQLGAHFVIIDSSLPLARKEYILENANPVVCITTEMLPGTHCNIISLEQISSAVPSEIKATGEGHLAYILYTSGSTGNPKGVKVTQQGVQNIFASTAATIEFDSQNSMLASSTASFDIAMIELLMPLTVGGTVVMLTQDQLKNGDAFQEAISNHGVTHMQGTPSTYKLLLQWGFSGAEHLTALTAGEQLPLALSKQILKIANRLFNLYGPTETTIYSTGCEVFASNDNITIGKPMHNTQIWICDEQLQPVAPGVEGEICIAGLGVADGYVKLPEITQEKFVNIAVNNQAITVYRTADIGYINLQNQLVCLGRKDGQIKIRGYRVETGEIEARLQEHPLVKDAAVHFSKQANEEGILYGYIIPAVATNTWMERSWQTTTAKTLLAHLQNFLPDYALPQQLLFLESFPLNTAGKIDKRRLPVQEIQTQVSEDASLIEKVTAIWREVLQREEIAITDNFFQIGGHSLAGIAIISQIKKQLDIQLLPTTIFQYPTIASLVAMLPAAKKQPLALKCLIPIQPNGSRTPLFIVHGDDLAVYTFFHLAQNMHPEQPVYGLQAYGLNDTDALLPSFEALAAAYLKEIEIHQPEGPYFICGYSFGGIIAFEMAQQLLAKGKQVKLLGMFDTNAGNADHRLVGFNKFATKLIRQPKKFGFVLRKFQQNPAATTQTQIAQLKQRANAWLGKKQSDADFAEEHKFSQREMDILNNQYQAYYNYSLQPIHAVIHVFRSTEKSYFVDDPKFLGWKPYTTKGVHVVDVPANHNTMFALPHAVKFAAALQKAIDES